MTNSLGVTEGFGEVTSFFHEVGIFFSRKLKRGYIEQPVETTVWVVFGGATLHRTLPNFMALLTAEFCAYDHDSPLTCKRRISALAL